MGGGWGKRTDESERTTEKEGDGGWGRIKTTLGRENNRKGRGRIKRTNERVRGNNRKGWVGGWGRIKKTHGRERITEKEWVGVE